MRRSALVAVSTVGVVALAYGYFRLPSPRWDHSIEASVLYTFPGAMHIDFNYIPDVQVRGDGRIVWVERRPEGGRRVLEGRLTEAELLLTVQRAIEGRAFDPLGTPSPAPGGCPYSGVDNELVIRLLRAAAVERIRSSSPAICSLVLFLAFGARTGGAPYQPELGLLYPIPVEETGLPITSGARAAWPAELLLVNLHSAYEQRGSYEIEGLALEWAWDFVNQNPEPIVSFEGTDYWLGVQVPDLLP